MSSSDTAPSGPLQPIIAQYTKLSRQYQQLLDRITPFVLYRWLGFAGMLSLFMLRILMAQGVSFFFVSRLASFPPWDVRILAEYHPGLGGVQWYIG